jgi:hypothetical protein
LQGGTGSALDALKVSVLNREMDFAVSRRGAGMKAAGFKQEGDLAYAKGKAAMASGIISGAAEIASEVAGAFGGVPGGGGGGSGASGANSAPSSSGYNVGGGTSAYFSSHPFGG